MLDHVRIARSGVSLYGPPAVEFTPFAYPPLYPYAVALLTSAAPLSFAVARALSLAATLGAFALVALTGSNLKGNNLLFAIFCVLIAQFVVSGILTVVVARGIELSRLLPSSATAGGLFTVGIRLRNLKKFWPVFCLRIQDRVAQQLKALRYEHGALDLETIEARPVFDGDVIRDLDAERRNRAKELIEDFMIAANGVTARYLKARKYPSLRRVVRSPKRWERIVEVASRYGATLPPEPDPRALGQFLAGRKAADPLRFPDLSLTIIKLMGAGEYVPEFPEETASGHFGLAVRDYTHSTAPNRRYPDLITQRLLKAAITGSPMPYGRDELTELARHCTEKEDDANKVERLVVKSAAAMLLAPRTGERFDAIVTGAAPKGTWVRLFHPPIEGKLVHGFEGVDVGHRIRVQLVHTDVERGYIDFKRVD